MTYYYEIIPFGQIQETLSYKFDKKIPVGTIVQIPLRKKTHTGVVLAQTFEKYINFDLKKILSINSFYQHPISMANIEFYKYLSLHYFIDLGMVFKMSLQHFPLVNLKNYFYFKNKIFISQKALMVSFNLSSKQWSELNKNNFIESTTKSFIFQKMIRPIELNKDQSIVYKKIWKNENINFSTHLIDGVTGSGKTEIYLKLIEENLRLGNQSLVLLPEITLSEEWSKRFKNYFGCDAFVWHSKQTKQQKSRILRSLLNGEPCVLVGARSAVLLPFKNLKLIICDEEHDSSYKQEDGPKYHARDMSIYKAKCNNAICILVSASASLESLFNVNQKKIKIYRLENQYHSTELPEISIIDMRALKPSSKSWITKIIYDTTIKVLKNQGQVLFFLNRRGYAPTKICTNCHAAVQCQNCAVNLVYHKQIDRLICHHCSSFYEPQQICKMCSSEKFVSIGIGLERLQEEVERLFPGYKSQIFSSDTLKSKKNKKNLINNIFSNETHILIGSQIIGKSFHFPNLKLVNIIDGDSSLFSPDFRAMEKTYQLLQQVAGRSGREGKRGKVLIQTYNPQHSIFQSIKKQNREEFVSMELLRRQQNKLPPYSKIALLQFIHPDFLELRKICNEVLNISQKNKLSVYGPTPSLIPYKKNHYQENFYFKEQNYTLLREKIDIIKSQLTPKNIRFLNIDIDPLSIA